ncbi:MAG TPA: methylmalonyl-CoA mutase subunit beta [Microthrixaceae bacterium]|nr:methylmalonyl-CoA mutase subunit beta [Microthrixaceae bacterium]
MPPEAEPALAAEFPPATEEQWLSLVDKVLKGGPLSRLESTTPGGLTIHPLYTREGDPVDDEAVSQPGLSPFTRGSDKSRPEELPWGIRVLLETADPVAASKLAVRGLERGSTELLVRFDEAFRSGVAPGEAGFDDLCGADGVAITTVEDLAATLSGVLLDLAPVHLEAGSQFTRAADLLIAVLESNEITAKQASGGVGADPIGFLATSGKLPQGIEAALEELGALAARLADSYPGVRAVSVDTTPYVEAGASEVQELAVMLSTGAAYLRAMAAADIGIDDACRQIEVTLSADADVFNCIAKLRAARRVWSTMTAACGATDEAQAMRQHVRTADRMMTKRDPWVNLLRVTAANFAAGVGGAASVTTASFDSQLGEPVELGDRLARNTQLLLQDESNIGRVIDPMGGSWFIESLTDEIATAAWALFQELESQGGLPRVLLDGSLAERIETVRSSRLDRVARRVEPITGVSEFPDIHEALEVRTSPDRSAVRAQAAKATVPAAAYSTGSSSIGSSSTGSGATSSKSTECTPLISVRWAQDFEVLRDRSDAQVASSGTRPRVFLVNIGPVAVHTARASFAKNFFESGGIEAVTSERGSSTGFDATAEGASAAVADLAADGAQLVCICSSDAVYAEIAEEFARALGASGMSSVYLAGNPGDSREALSKAGANEFIHVGVNALDVLQRAHDLLGTPGGAEVLV